MSAQLLLEKLDIAEQAIQAFPEQAAFWAARIAELARLLEIVVQGRAGTVPESFTPPAPRPPSST